MVVLARWRPWRLWAGKGRNTHCLIPVDLKASFGCNISYQTTGPQRRGTSNRKLRKAMFSQEGP